MMKRTRSYPVTHNGFKVEEETCQSPREVEKQGFVEQHQVLFELLRRTSLAEQTDSEIYEWLRDAHVWIGKYAQNVHFTAGSQAELRFLVLGVLETMPWWRLFTWSSVHKSIVTGEDGTQYEMRSIHRRHERIQLAFENVCLLLIGQSPHAVRGVLEVAMKPFRMRLPTIDGAAQRLPGNTIMRLMNAVATLYRSDVVLDVLHQCMRFLVPRWRWGERLHHRVCISLFLHLALETHIPVISTLGAGGYYARDGHRSSNGYCKEEFQGNIMEHHANFPSSREASLSNSDVGSKYRGGNRTFNDPHLHRMGAASNEVSRASNSDTELSDTGQSVVSTTMSDISRGASARHGGALNLDHCGAQDNRMLVYRSELIQFVLQWLLDLELSLHSHESESKVDMSRPQPSSSHRPETGKATSIPFFVAKEIRPLEMTYVETLRECTCLVFNRLVGDLRSQQKVGVCGNNEWWRELLAFHINSVLTIECPIFLIYLAPSLALLGGEEDATDMIRKLLLLVTKGYQPVQQSGCRTSGNAGSARVRMAPPTVGQVMVPMSQRLRAALHIYPLCSFMSTGPCNLEEIQKQLQKHLCMELKKATDTPSTGSSSGGALQTSFNPLVQVLFAQYAALSELLGISGVEPISSIANNSRAVRALLDTYLTLEESEVFTRRLYESDGKITIETANKPTAIAKKSRFNLLKMQQAGLLYPDLMSNCPWDWKMYQKVERMSMRR